MKEYDAVRLAHDDAETGLKAGVRGTIVSERQGDTFLVEFFLDPDEPARGQLFRVPVASLALLVA